MRPRRFAVAGVTTGVLLALGAPVPAHAAATAAAGNLDAIVYPAPAGTPDALEPSIGNDWKTGATMYLAGQTTLKVTFDDSTAPPAATWTDVSGPVVTNTTSLDPILFTDSSEGRTFVSELSGACSFMEYTDDDGAGWTPSEGCGPPAGPDHQTVGAGPYSAAVPVQNPAFDHAVYYCSQAVATAQCARSDNGGLSFGPGEPAYTFASCGGLHGHIRVSPDGTVYLPNQNCTSTPDPAGGASNTAGSTVFPNQAAVVSSDDGTTWSVRVLPKSHATLRSDPSVASDRANTVFFGYEDAVRDSAGDQVGGHPLISTSKDHGSTWSDPVDVGAPFGIQNVTFPEVIAGDPGRAAFAFLGSTSAGNPENQTFHGTWELYLSATYDGGATWTTADLTPGDPVERDCIYLAGNGDCPETNKRNLLDFMDITTDKQGRALIGFADGCTAACDAGQTCDSTCNTGPGASTARQASIARQSCGLGLFAAADGTLGCNTPAAGVPDAPLSAALLLAGGASIGAVGWLRRRGRWVRGGG
jgi:hypothetical protein